MSVTQVTRHILRKQKAFTSLSSLTTTPRRHLSIHEYQSQDLLRNADVHVARGCLATTVDEVADAIATTGVPCVLKSQVLAGGRGKGHFDSGLKHGIHVVHDKSDAVSRAGGMLGHRLITKQTSAEGLLVDKLYVAEKVDYSKEYYLAMTVDREAKGPVIISSRHGGTSIEEIAKQDPDAITRVNFDYINGVTDDVVSSVAQSLNVTGTIQTAKLLQLLQSLFSLFKSKDATLLEINPLVLTTQTNDFLCLDAKFNFDDAAKPRQADLFALEEKSQTQKDDPTSLAAAAESSGLVYIPLSGNIGNVVNGAGLAMATNDAITHFGGSSANFLDTGGQATKETMLTAFRIILADERVKVILVNIYGGIIRCDMIAESITAAAKELGTSRVPLVVRLQGTNAEVGQKIVADAKLSNVYPVFGFGEAAQLAVKLAAS